MDGIAILRADIGFHKGILFRQLLKSSYSVNVRWAYKRKLDRSSLKDYFCHDRFFRPLLPRHLLCDAIQFAGCRQPLLTEQIASTPAIIQAISLGKGSESNPNKAYEGLVGAY